MIRVLLADDQALIRTGFRMILSAAPDIKVVGEAIDGADAVRQTRALAPDVVLMDVRMPGMDGIEATGAITSTTPSRVLILTTFDLDEYAFDGLRQGASGFLLKDVLPEHLLAGIRAVASGDAVLSPRITAELIARHSTPAPPARAPGPDYAHLTGREREILDAIAEGLSNAEIAHRLAVSEATVKTHVTRIFAKLSLRDRVQAVIYAYECGLRG